MTDIWRFREESTSMERLDGETILIDFESGKFFSFRHSAADIAWLIEHGAPRSEWPSTLATAFPDFAHNPTAEAEIDSFVSDLREAGLIEEAPASASVIGDLPGDYARTEWRAPRVAVNDSLSDLLAIDPIHDVSDDGWPQTPDR